jgi:hypothetical protein
LSKAIVGLGVFVLYVRECPHSTHTRPH